LPPVKVESQKLADGVWLLGGGTHNSVLVEFKDFAAVVEAPQNEARSLAVIEEANRLAANKPIKYVVNTHHHFDHAGGLRTYLSQGTTVITHESNKQYYLDIMFYPAPRELQPDRMALYSPMYMISRRPAPIETVASLAGAPAAALQNTPSPMASAYWRSFTCRIWPTSWKIRRTRKATIAPTC
jgi:glyoxylase-like metal-dependent hydrolase (beta-lactamase superfamily II)